jgi:hypothetical protein
LLIEPASVLHGAVCEHGLRSSPSPETQVRAAWALAWGANAPARAVNRAAAVSSAGNEK